MAKYIKIIRSITFRTKKNDLVFPSALKSLVQCLLVYRHSDISIIMPPFKVGPTRKKWITLLTTAELSNKYLHSGGLLRFPV